ncbi:MAG TPA: glycosyltransferase family 4 protein, partial [Nitrospira sp.]|nr:glycosyltransferase family 4 protein [Nitrospira sp.]
MNVWIVNQYAVPPSQSGGTRHYKLARLLARKGHRVTIVAADLNYQTGEPCFLKTGETSGAETIDGVRFLWQRVPAYQGNSIGRVHNMLGFSRRVLSSMRHAAEDLPDVIIGSSPQPFAALAAQRIASRLGVPFVLEIRDLWPQSLVDLGNLSPRHPFVLLLAAVERRLYRGARRIVTVLPNAARHMIERGARPERIVCVPNGVDLSDAGEPVPPCRSDHFTVMYAGAHGVANDLHTVLDAAAKLRRDDAAKDIRFRLIGDGPLNGTLQQRAAREG